MSPSKCSSARSTNDNSSPLVYVAGPFSQGIVSVNVHNAIKASNTLLDKEYTPFCPHALTHLSNIVEPRPQQDWLDFDMRWLKVCDAVLRLPGTSAGSDNEIAMAKQLGIPVFYSIADLDRHFKTVTAHAPALDRTL